ncbi:MAG: hypothetical protein A4E55_00292 [Pelotomaculum sp. PtaU1.Bin035]|nr:MAG: hypothetical protein A4E55_00292 [Pelotomaculum sp. PtaU1.Bin035]
MEKYSGQDIYVYLVKTPQGVILGGKVNKQTTVAMSGLSEKEREISLPPGKGYLYQLEKTALVHIPQAGY